MKIFTAYMALLICLSLFGARLEAQGFDPAYERRAQEAAAGLVRLNGLRTVTPNTPADWPEASPKTGLNPSRPLFAAGWNRQAQPARLETLIIVNQGLRRAANLGGLGALRRLELYGNALRGLNLEGNAALTHLLVTKNELPGLDPGQSPRLELLAAADNQLEKLDLGGNPELRELYLSMNRLQELDLSRNRRLRALELMNNEIARLDLSGCPELGRLILSHNRLAELDLSANPALSELRAGGNELARLDLRNNAALTELAVDRNRLTELRLDGLPALSKLSAEHNQLSRLDLRANRALVSLEAQRNPLSEIVLGDNELERLEVINLDGCRLPLSALAALSGKAQKRARFGSQGPVLFENAKLPVGQPLDLSPEAVIEGVPTEFDVLTEKKRRVKAADYSLDQGRIIFHLPGRYQVLMSNQRAYSSEINQMTGRTRTFKVKALTGLIEVVPANIEDSPDAGL